MANPVLWFEILGVDGKGLQNFYSKTFGWSINVDNPMNYGMIEPQDGRGIGGGIGTGENGMTWSTIYIEVADVDAMLKTVTENGGEIIVPKTVIPEMVTFAVFADPEGNKIGLFEPKKC